MDLAWQQSLFDETPDDASRLGFERARRVTLDERSWLDVIPSWLPEHGEVFDQLLDIARWQHRERWMYDRTVLEPRLVATWGIDDLDGLPEPLEQIRTAVSEHYRANFDSVLVNLYRDGRDGVAWHGDTVRKQLDQAVVVTVGLGERRRFLLRRGTTGPATHILESGHGDLIVMGGRCQHEWQHTVPKAAGAGARMSITLRHLRPAR
jgi:alkylated DNA repair dioxygenase AlkB